MSFLNKVSVRSALTLALALLALLFVGTNVHHWLNARKSYESMQRIYDITSTKAIALEKVFTYMMRERLGSAVYSFAADKAMPDQQALMLKVLPTHLQNIDKYLAAFDAIKMPDAEGQQLADAVVKEFHGYLDNFVKPTYDAVVKNDVDNMKTLQLASTQGALGLNDALAQFNKYAGSLTTQMLDAARADVERSERVTALALVGALLLGAAIYIGAVRGIIRPLGQAARHFDQIAAGDLSVAIGHDGKNEIHLLFASLRQMQSRLSGLVASVRKGAEEIDGGVTEIATGNNDLSARTEQQAASLEETASSMEQLTATVRQNTENARQANVLADGASGLAARGGDVVGRVVETMNGISESSAKVAEIISIIEGIAFQTNILALNAAVEAARAGEQGRGFAVVAAEVRTLAQRSATAAKGIKELIDQSAQRIQSGAKLVGEAGATMSEIVSSVKRVASIVSEISVASAEQSHGIEQVNQAVSQMDQATQQNAALVEQASAAAQSLSTQTTSLKQAVSVFKVAQPA